jgi:hypothetical protein
MIASNSLMSIISDAPYQNHAMQRTRDAVCRYGKSAVAGR